MSDECKHIIIHTEVKYNMKPGGTELEHLDITKPYVISICADCGLFLKTVEVTNPTKPY